MERPLEGYEVTEGRYKPVAAVGRGGRGRYLHSRVLGLDLRSAKRDGATVLVFRDPRTGEEFDGGLEEAERRRQAAEKRASAAESQARQEAGLRRAAEKRVRALEERLRNLTARTPPSGRDSQG